MKIKQLQSILDQQPSVSGNTYFIFIVWGISWLFALVFLLLGIGLLLESMLHYKIFLDTVAQKLHLVLTDEQRWNISTSLGWLSIVLALVFGAMIYICKMVLVRNHFIILLEEWLISEIKEVKINRKISKK